MMKHQWTVALAGAALFGIPAIASQEGNALASLQSAIDSTQAALQELVSLEPRLSQQDPEAIQRLMDLTEPTAEDPQVVDQSIVRLRADIQRLQHALDQGPSANGSAMPAKPTTGLRPGELSNQNVVTSKPSPSNVVPGSRALEQPGYSADEVRQAKLHVRTNQYEQAIPLLRKQDATPETRYWLARALQGTGEMTEAKDLLQKLAAEGETQHRYARWAAGDLRMIELREKLSQQAKPKGDASKSPAKPQ